MNEALQTQTSITHQSNIMVNQKMHWTYFMKDRINYIAFFRESICKLLYDKHVHTINDDTTEGGQKHVCFPLHPAQAQSLLVMAMEGYRKPYDIVSSLYVNESNHI